MCVFLNYRFTVVQLQHSILDRPTKTRIVQVLGTSVQVPLYVVRSTRSTDIQLQGTEMFEELEGQGRQ